jgi:hypothetical protein
MAFERGSTQVSRTDWFQGAEGGKSCPTAAPQRPSNRVAGVVLAPGGEGFTVAVVTGPGWHTPWSSMLRSGRALSVEASPPAFEPPLPHPGVSASSTPRHQSGSNPRGRRQIMTN